MNLRRLFVPAMLTALCTAAPVLSGVLFQDPAQEETTVEEEKPAVTLYYLEFVTPDVETTCALLAEQHGVTFGEPDAPLGGARTAPMLGGGLLGVRAPMHAAEEPTVRPYRIVEDIQVATDTAVAAGGKLMVPPSPSPGRGKYSIYELGGLQHALWQP